MWQLQTPDGHVVATSREFGSRSACEADALTQGLPVQGLSKAKRTAVQEPAQPRPGLRVYSDRTGLWRWTVADEHGKVAGRSRVAYLTKDEAFRDADVHAPRSIPLLQDSPAKRS